MVPSFTQRRKVYDQFGQFVCLFLLSTLRWNEPQDLLYPFIDRGKSLYFYMGRLYGLGIVSIREGIGWSRLSVPETGVGLFKGLGLLHGHSLGFLGEVLLGSSIDSYECQRFIIVLHLGIGGSLEVKYFLVIFFFFFFFWTAIIAFLGYCLASRPMPTL
jgi:hypothetical protein